MIKLLLSQAISQQQSLPHTFAAVSLTKPCNNLSYVDETGLVVFISFIFNCLFLILKIIIFLLHYETEF